MAENKPSIGLQVSQEELWCILKLLNIPAIPGCKVPEDDTQRRDVMSVMYGTAENSLITQGVIRITTDAENPTSYRRHLDKRVVALVGSGALAEKVLELAYETQPGIITQSWIYFVPGLQVWHEIENGITHRFIALTDGEMLLAAVGRSLRLHTNTQPVNKGIDIVIKSKQLWETYQLAQETNDESTIVKKLIKAGLADEVAHMLAQVLKKTLGLGFVSMSAPKKSQQDEGFNFLETPDHYWLLTPEEDEFRIRQASLTDITGKIVTIIKNF